MKILYGLAGLGLIASFLADVEKSKEALKIAWQTFIKILPLLLITLSCVSVVLFLLPSSAIADYLGDSNMGLGSFFAAIIGSISLLPGFITFPLCGLLLKQGVSYTVLAVFSTTLMMVGLLTFPLESEYFGKKIALLRNISALLIALVVSVVVGLLYGEIII